VPSIQPFPFGAFVVDVVFLGDTAAFALGDGTVRLVKGPGAEAVRVHGGAVLSAARTLDGKAIVTGGDDGLVALTDAAGAVTRLAEHPKKWIDAVAAGPDGAVAYAVGKTAHVRFGDGTARAFEHERAVGGLAFAPKGMRLGVARYGGVSLWWPKTEAGPTSLEWKGSHIGITFSPDGRYVVTAMQENALHGWRLDGGGHLRMTGYPAKPRSLSWSVKGRFLASSGSESAVLWPFHFKDGPQGKEPVQIGRRREAMVTRVACHPSDDALAIGYADGAVTIARLEDGGAVLIREPGDGAVSALNWDDSGLRFAFGTEQGMAGVIDIRNG
jgi:WD40 repeat protein